MLRIICPFLFSVEGARNNKPSCPLSISLKNLGYLGFWECKGGKLGVALTDIQPKARHHVPTEKGFPRCLKKKDQ